jgi:hypothetical protein
MKKTSLASFIALVSLFCSVSKNIYSQTQNPNWVLFSTSGTNPPQSGTTNISFGSNPYIDNSPPFYKETPVQFTDENNVTITSYRGFNAYFDNDGFPVIYVINKDNKTYIYDKHGNKYTKKHSNPSGLCKLLKDEYNLDPYANKDYVEPFSPSIFGDLNLTELKNSSREISILKVGCNLLHVISGEMIIEVDLTLKSWDYFLPFTPDQTSLFSSTLIDNLGIRALEMGSGQDSFYESFHSIRRDPNYDYIYTIYYIYSTIASESDSRPVYLNKITVNTNTYAVEYGSSYFIRNTDLPKTFLNDGQFISEFEISPDGSRLAIHDQKSILVYGINSSTKNIDQFVGYYNYRSINPLIQFAISGLEFNSSSNKLVFNRFDANATTSSPLTNNLGILDLSSISNYVISASFFSESIGNKNHSVITRGGLELGRNGEIYSVGKFGLHKINFSTQTLNDIPDVLIPNSGTINLTNDINLGALFAIRPLPEQIDGQAFVSEGYHLDDEIFPELNAGLVFNNLSTSSGIIKIRGLNEIYSQQSLSVAFENTTIHPATSTTIKVMNGANLEITNTNIETDGCNIMWNGIVVQNGGSLKIQNSTNQEKFIKDAIIGIDYSGTESGLLVQDYTFDRNERSIRINNGGVSGSTLFMGNIQIRKSLFGNTEILKDITKGQLAINGQNANKGISSLEVYNTGTSINNLFLEENDFNGGLFGVKATNSFIHISGCNYSNIKGIVNINFSPRVNFNYASAIFIEKNNNNNIKYSLKVDNNSTNNISTTFSDNTRHVTAYNGVNLNIHTVNFNGSYQKGIEWVKNKGCSLEVLNSSFLNCANSSIYCDDNSFPSKVNLDRTYLSILGNTFSNDKYNLLGTENTPIFQYDANALMINDLGKTANTGYSHIEVASNQIYNLRTGILVNGVTGGKSDLTRPEGNGGIYNIDNNYPTIVRPTSNTIFPSGIHVINSNYLAAFQNDIIASNNQNRISNNGNAIYLENSSNISLKSNSLKGKYGIRAKMNNIGSEILCNTFSRNRFGLMYSDKHLLRNTFRTHGIKAVESRSNNYIQTGISDMHWIEPLDNVKNWWVIENNGTVKEACYQAGTTKSCFGPFTPPGSSSPIFVFQTLIKDYAPDICKGQFPVGSPNEIEADNSSDQISQWELDFSYGLNDLITNPNYVLTDKIRIIKALEYAQTNIFDTALIFLNHNFENNLDQKYATLLKKYIGFSYPVAHQPDYTDEQYIRSIANKTPSIEGSHVYLARSIMQSLYDEQFSERDTAYADVHIELINTSCLQSTEELQVVMFNSFQDEIPIQYAFDNAFNLQIFGEGLNELNLATEYTIKVTHQSNEYQVTKTLFDLLNNENSIDLNCEINLGKRNSNLISKNDNISSLMVFPNPVNGILTIKGLNDDDQKCDIKVVDFLGRTIMEVDNQNGNNGLDLSYLNTGVYCLLIKNANTNYKFIIQKQ